MKYDRHDIQSEDICLSGKGGTDKSPFGVICNTISKTLLYLCKEPNKSRVFLPGRTKISSVYIGGTKFHSGLETKLGPKLLGSNDKSKADLRNRLLRVKLLTTD